MCAILEYLGSGERVESTAKDRTEFSNTQDKKNLSFETMKTFEIEEVRF